MAEDNVTTEATPLPISPEEGVSTDGSQAAKITFLIVFILVGFVGNMVLMATIAFSRRSRKKPELVICATLGLLNTFDCLINQPFILAAILTHRYYSCSINALFIQLFSLATLSTTLVLVSVPVVAFFDQFTPTRSRLVGACAIVWLCSLVMSIPVATTVVPVSFAGKSVCTFQPGTPLSYLVPLITLAFAIPLALIVLLLAFVCCRRLLSADVLTPSVSVSAHTFGAVMALVWVLTELPFLVHAWLIATSTNWQNLESGYVEIVVTWLRLSYPLYLPMVAFCLSRDLWNRFKSHLPYHKSNVINDGSSRGSTGPEDGQSRPRNVPMLYVGADGLSIRHPNSKNSLSSSGTQKCDVANVEETVKVDYSLEEIEKVTKPFKNDKRKKKKLKKKKKKKQKQVVQKYEENEEAPVQANSLDGAEPVAQSVNKLNDATTALGPDEVDNRLLNVSNTSTDMMLLKSDAMLEVSTTHEHVYSGSPRPRPQPRARDQIHMAKVNAAVTSDSE